MSEGIALHEAAHAVVAEELGFRPTSIELTQVGTGMCYFEDYQRTLVEQELRGYGIDLDDLPSVPPDGDVPKRRG